MRNGKTGRLADWLKNKSPSLKCLKKRAQVRVRRRSPHRLRLLLLRSLLGRQQRAGRAGARRTRRVVASFSKISAKCCSFSAVSAPIFATKYAFCSSFQNLPDFQTEIFEIWQYFIIFCKFCDICEIFAEISRKLLFFQTDFLRNF